MREGTSALRVVVETILPEDDDDRMETVCGCCIVDVMLG